MKFVHTRKYVVQASPDDDIAPYFEHIEEVEPKNENGVWVIEIPMLEGNSISAYNAEVDGRVATHLRSMNATWSVVETASHRPENPFILVDLSGNGAFADPEMYGALVDLISERIAEVDGREPLVYVEEYENLPSDELFDIGTVVAVSNRAPVHGFNAIAEAEGE